MTVMQKIQTAIAATGVLLPLSAFAQGFQQQVAFEGVAAGSDLIGTVTSLINTALVLAALVAAVYLIIGGVRYITSGGDEDAQGEAKNTILYAIIGLIVIGLSAVIVNFVVSIF